MPSRHKTSLIAMGMPQLMGSGEAGSRRHSARRRSAASAWERASSGVRARKAWSCESRRSIRSRQACVRSREESWPSRKAEAASRRERSVGWGIEDRWAPLPAPPRGGIEDGRELLAVAAFLLGCEFQPGEMGDVTHLFDGEGHGMPDYSRARFASPVIV